MLFFRSHESIRYNHPNVADSMLQRMQFTVADQLSFPALRSLYNATAHRMIVGRVIQVIANTATAMKVTIAGLVSLQ